MKCIKLIDTTHVLFLLILGTDYKYLDIERKYLLALKYLM